MVHRALAIGISSYTSLVPLTLVKNEAKEVYAKLVSLDFEAVLCFDLASTFLHDTVRSFFSRVNEGDTAVFYFSGHCFQGNDFILLPADATMVAPTEHGVSLRKDIFPLIKICRARLVVIIIDTCRDLTLPRSITAVTEVPE